MAILRIPTNRITRTCPRQTEGRIPRWLLLCTDNHVVCTFKHGGLPSLERSRFASGVPVSHAEKRVEVGGGKNAGGSVGGHDAADPCRRQQRSARLTWRRQRPG